MLRLIFAGIACAVALPVYAQNFTIGETTKYGYSDSGGNTLATQGPYATTKSATPVSESFWVDSTGGQLILGIYTAGPNNNCLGGALVAQSAPFTPVKGWNTQSLTSTPTVPAGNYCLAYLPSSNGVKFRKGLKSGPGDHWTPFQFAPLPAKYATANVSGPDGYLNSIYATLAPTSNVQTPVAVSFNPTTARVSDAAAAGTVLAAVLVQTSDGTAFMGSGLSISAQTAAGLASLSSPSLPSNVQVASVAAADDGQQSVTVQACENSVCVSGQLPVMVNAVPPPPTLSLSFNPPTPNIAQNVAPGTHVATAVATWSNGSTFTGTYAFGSPGTYGNDGGEFAINSNTGDITVGISGLAADANKPQNITVVATQ